jgi:class 3 adenylate cyclase
LGLFHRYRYVRNTRNELSEKNKIINKEKERSDELLLNILPAETAEELKNSGKSQARHFDLVTVMFTDFKGFTYMAEKLSPQELVDEIDYCFKHFDQIISKYNIEKIKTIGDAYMCAGGLPVANITNPLDVVKAGLEIQQFMQKLKEQKKAENKPYFELRIGINSGPVVAGIVGIKKFQYDIWGDTVNIASRMESSGEIGKVNISQMTYEKIKHRFSCEHRGKIEAKNKGAVDMYFVKSEIT